MIELKFFGPMCLLFVVLFYATTSIARSSADDRIDNCSGNVTCIAKVLAELIQGDGDHGGGGGSTESVEFYHDDGKCEFDELITVVRIGISESECERRAPAIRDRVWGIKYAGRCKNISDKNFIDACKMISLGVIPSSEEAALK